jgi:hypothetical protein
MPAQIHPALPEIEHITSLSDPVLRNLQITQCYHELAMVLAERTGWSANWCTFATWASKQAGQTIRKEDLARTLEEAVGSQEAIQPAVQSIAAAAQRLGVKLGVDEILEAIWKALDVEAAFSRSSEAVARGNLKVFAEIGQEFARFYDACLDGAHPDAEKIARFCEALRPGEPPEGQDYLRRAFQHYYQAFFEEDEKKRIELLLLANIEIGFHEQTRLQPEISEALAAPIISPQEFGRNLIKALRPDGGWLTQVLWLILHLFRQLADFDAAIETVVAGAQRQAQLIVTETMMTIELPPNNRLRLGDDLTTGFPRVLQQIANPELLDLLAQIDPTPDSQRESGADYWGDLPDRLHFIADMFRSYETAKELFQPPFSAEQTTALKQGYLPSGRL